MNKQNQENKESSALRSPLTTEGSAASPLSALRSPLLITDFIEVQLQSWPLAAKNYQALARVERRPFRLGRLQGALQFNPARAVSTGADVSAAALRARPCFLCRDNRPAEQMVFQSFDGWEMLLNPFPIFPVHFTIAAVDHRPQDAIPADIVSIAARFPGLAVFFNGARAGASAPDHCHLQAVLADELPLIRHAMDFESGERRAESGEVLANAKTTIAIINDPGLPFNYYLAKILPDADGYRLLHYLESGYKSDTPSQLIIDNLKLLIGDHLKDGRLNAIAWLADDGYVRMILIPRSAHRPPCYYAEGDRRRMVSPGTIDMAGIMVTPRESDFRALTDADIRAIYAAVGAD